MEGMVLLSNKMIFPPADVTKPGKSNEGGTITNSFPNVIFFVFNPFYLSFMYSVLPLALQSPCIPLLSPAPSFSVSLSLPPSLSLLFSLFVLYISECSNAIDT